MAEFREGRSGARNDATLMVNVGLLAHGPVYLMDLGFVKYRLIERWIMDGARFVFRLHANTVCKVASTLGTPRRYGSGRIVLDAIAQLGTPQATARPFVRLIVANITTRAGMQPLLVTTGELQWGAERVLGACKERGRNEQLHRLLKDNLGPEHPFNFSQAGLNFLLYTAVLAALLVLRTVSDVAGDIVNIHRCVGASIRGPCR